MILVESDKKLHGGLSVRHGHDPGSWVLQVFSDSLHPNLIDSLSKASLCILLAVTSAAHAAASSATLRSSV